MPRGRSATSAIYERVDALDRLLPLSRGSSLVEPRTFAIQMTAEELGIVLDGLDGLDALEYWELGDRLPRNNGEVFIPGDLRPEADRYWGRQPEPSEEEQEAIDQVRRCRALAEHLRAIESR